MDREGRSALLHARHTARTSRKEKSQTPSLAHSQNLLRFSQNSGYAPSDNKQTRVHMYSEQYSKLYLLVKTAPGYNN